MALTTTETLSGNKTDAPAQTLGAVLLAPDDGADPENLKLEDFGDWRTETAKLARAKSDLAKIDDATRKVEAKIRETSPSSTLGAEYLRGLDLDAGLEAIDALVDDEEALERLRRKREFLVNVIEAQQKILDQLQRRLVSAALVVSRPAFVAKVQTLVDAYAGFCAAFDDARAMAEGLEFNGFPNTRGVLMQTIEFTMRGQADHSLRNELSGARVWFKAVGDEYGITPPAKVPA